MLTESIQAANLEVEALGIETVLIVTAPDHPLAKKTVVRTQDLEGQTILLSKVDCSYRRSFQHIVCYLSIAIWDFCAPSDKVNRFNLNQLVLTQFISHRLCR